MFSYIVNPNKTFLYLLDTLQNTKLLTYCSLVFLALNGRIRCPLDYVKNTNINKKLTLVKQACTQHCDEKFSFENLVEENEILVKNARWFQKGDCDMYSFRHTSVYEIVAYHFGKNNKNALLACIGYKYITEKVPLVNEMNEEYQTGLTVPVDIETLQERLLADIRDMKNFDVFTNACWENLSFCNTF